MTLSETQRANDLVPLILDYHGLREFYATALGQFPGPVAVEPPEESNIEALRQRYSILAVQKPFYGPFFNIVGTVASPGQGIAMEFRARYTNLRRRVEDYCAKHDRPGLRSALRANDVTSSDGERILSALALHIEHLKSELSMDPNAMIDLRFELEFSVLLREARTRRSQTQPKAAETLHVSLATYKVWEAGKHSPGGENKKNVLCYIRAALTEDQADITLKRS
jgi:DNA-binding transcriptional regulator YiaG